MSDISFSLSDIEASRRFLAARPLKATESYFLLKEEELLAPEDRQFFTCAIHAVSALIAVNEGREYLFSLNILGLPGDTDGIAGLEKVLKGVEVAKGYEVNLHSGKPTSERGSYVVTALYGPQAKIIIDNALAFQLHAESFCEYSGRALDEAIGSNYEWRVPAKNFIFQSGQLQPFDPKKDKK